MQRADVDTALEIHHLAHRGPIIGPTPTIKFRLTGVIEAKFRFFPGQLQQEPALLLSNATVAHILARQTVAQPPLCGSQHVDIAAIQAYLGVVTAPVYCTKIASKLVRTYTDRHGLKDLVKELLGVDMSKEQQSSDWGAAELSDKQLAYAASDVAHLHRLRDALDTMLAREGRTALAAACFGFLPSRVELDLAGWAETDIFAH